MVILAAILMGCQWTYIPERHDCMVNYGRPEGVRLVENVDELRQIVRDR